MSRGNEDRSSIRVLFVDDSRIQQGLWRRLLSQSPEITVAATASSAEEIPDAVASARPDVILLDINLPGMSGIEFLEQHPAHALPPCIILSAFVHGANDLRARARAAGAKKVISKPQEGSPTEIKEVFSAVRAAILETVGADGKMSVENPCPVTVPEFGATSGNTSSTRSSHAQGVQRNAVVPIVIGSSTGGPAVLAAILSGLPRQHPPILIAQHISSSFSQSLTKSLAEQTGLRVVEIRSGDALRPNTVYVAPGDRHARVRMANETVMLMTIGRLPNTHHCPSIDELMKSSVAIFGGKPLGILLTGMGSDGADGLVAMKHAGCRTIAQDAASSTVFGMARTAIERGGADVIGPPEIINAEILRWIRDAGPS